ncbi:MAG: hypothetical protein LAO20_02170 [Acidobacteriia bacterium]|nr:hypothetical protein [Terriglobia bacterium]
MKLLIVVALLAASAAGQNSSSPVQTDSKAPSLAVSYAGENNGRYRFRVADTSSHAVTAFALRLVPSGVPMVDGDYACGGQCGRSIVLGNKAKPAIRSGSAGLRSFAIASVNGGAVVAEAAIFDDGSYEGEDRAAAFLLANQIANQVEFDRLNSALTIAMTSARGDAQKTAQLRMKLGQVSVNLTPDMLRTLRLWFPALASCNQYARAMKHAAVREKQLVVQSMDQFAHNTSPTRPSLLVWRERIRQRLAAYGCTGCGAENPKPRTAAQPASMGCPDSSPVTSDTASLADDAAGAESDLTDVADAAELEAELDAQDMEAMEVMEAVDAVDDTLPAEPAPAGATADAPASSAPAPAAAVDAPPPNTRALAPEFPPGIPFHLGPDGKRMLWRYNYHGMPVPDSLVYQAWFRDIGMFADLAFHKVVVWDDGKWMDFDKSDPPAGGLSENEVEIVKRVSSDCNQQAALVHQKIDSLFRTKAEGLPGGWGAYAPPVPGYRELREKERATFSACVTRLRAQLSAASFAKVAGFVLSVYQATPGKIVPVPPSDDDIYIRFFTYVAWLNEPGLKNSAGGERETALRREEMRAAGIGDHEWELLVRIAADYRPPHLDQFAAVPAGGALGMFPMPAPGPAQPASPAVPVSQAANPGLPIGALQPASPQPMCGQANCTPVAVDPSSAALQQRADQASLNLISHIAQLQASMGDSAFHKLDAYLHKLYAPAVRERFVALTEPSGPKKEAAQTGKN